MPNHPSVLCRSRVLLDCCVDFFASALSIHVVWTAGTYLLTLLIDGRLIFNVFVVHLELLCQPFYKASLTSFYYLRILPIPDTPRSTRSAPAEPGFVGVPPSSEDTSVTR
ncbi:hypothetical protein NEOLEDRAFT_152660 [Neolentinus lepideus HHB14362 ss-1]|uniref:Uncharacterized protein n=1 Tax=Neolentinus lepideus HHB14362 ss-1 TaxID=1314782 RepID=A0A165MM21_9AGAM|nr:hypothetical protein NEOLEDRAFT_152660 [Neolentinus lepideus HHB14362 ss-1]